MLLHQSGYGGVPGKAGADARVVVERDGHAVARAADRDSAVHFPGRHRICERMGEIRVVAAIGAVGAEIDHIVSLSEEVTDQPGLVVEAGVVAADSYFHNNIGLIHINLYSLSARRHSRWSGQSEARRAWKAGPWSRWRRWQSSWSIT